MIPLPNAQFELDLNKYEKEAIIGAGTYGYVLKIKEKQTGNLFAAKIIKENQQKEQVDREIRILMSSNHPTIIKFIGYSLKDFDKNDHTTIIMNYANNGCLSDFLLKVKNKEKIKDYDNTSRQILLIGISRGMKYLHNRQIIHRDLKTGNVLLDENYYPYITDFGCSRQIDDQQMTFNIGTPAYMAPEIIDDEKQYGTKADVYSFSMIMYEVVTDSYPYPALMKKEISAFNLQRKIKEDYYRPVFETNVKESIKSLIERCWSKEPDDRPSFDEIFIKLTDKSCFLDNVDEKRVNKYIDMINKSNDSFDELISQNIELDRLNAQLMKDKSHLTNCNIYLQVENTKLNDENERLENEYKKIQEDNKKKEDEIIKLKAEIEKLNSKNQKMTIFYKKAVSKNKELNLRCNRLENEKGKLINENNKLTISNKQILTDNENMKKQIAEYKKGVPKIPKKSSLNSVESSYDVFSSLSSDSDVNILQKKDISIFEFNLLMLKQQQTILSKIRSLKKLNIFILFILNQFKELETLNCLKINSNCNDKMISLINKNDQIQFLSEMTNALFFNKLINSTEFINCLKSIEHFSIEIKYPSDSFQNIYDSIVDLRKTQFEKSDFDFSILIEKTDHTFYNNGEINSITFGNCVTDIQSDDIEKGLFEKCSSIKRIDFIPLATNELKIIGFNSFKECISLSEIIIPSSIKSIEKNAFCGCSSLTQISFAQPSSLESIGASSFRNCINLSEISIPSSVNTIGEFAFDNCSKLNPINFEQIFSVTSIGECAFRNCTLLKGLMIGKTLKKAFYKETFYGCSSIDGVQIPKSITEIGTSCFEDCTSLTNIIYELPTSLQYFRDSSFCGCSNLTILRIPSSTIEICSNAFKGCYSLSDVTFDNNSSLKSIGKYAFSGCSILDNLNIPPSVSEIKSYAFKDCSSLINFTISSNSIKTISCGTFEGCSSMLYFSVPTSVLNIEESAFEGCSSLDHVDFEQPCSIQSIGKKAFCRCTSLTKIVIPKSVIHIDKLAFDFCKSLKNISIPFSIDTDNLGLGSDANIVKIDEKTLDDDEVNN